ncbi:MAG: sigma 54-interacting transcriptional regulator [Proteobacteria bacterium]|nr:sigma 54-interacting transcriptional regulator [Pseudomonadota bacterium]MBU4471494.1 sigma 54-interacting transcriptional regulator [Pseudomonadota bacterium]MCG2752500.1 sigma 54-interacting transcriptional regulator [Desulfobacteraceae bacterium]
MIIKNAKTYCSLSEDIQKEIVLSFNDKAIITRDESFLKILDIAGTIAPTCATVLIQGESGTGKELLATYIHRKSMREGLYIAVNCASLPENLVESELFGYEKGAFTGAVKRKYGKFELANSGTIVLDEISELSLNVQAKLLRVLQEKAIDRIGGYDAIPIDFRLIAISNIDLKLAVKENKFRKDLFYRLNVIPLNIPPLRNRKYDIDLLLDYFLIKFSNIYNLEYKPLDEKARKALNNNAWEGNVRELENVIERAILMSGKDKTITDEYVVIESLETQPKEDNFDYGFDSLKTMEKEMIFRTLNEVNENRTVAAKRLGISIRTLRNKLNEYRENQNQINQVSSL